MLEIPAKYIHSMLPLRMSLEDKLCQSMLRIAVLRKSVLVSMLLGSVQMPPVPILWVFV